MTATTILGSLDTCTGTAGWGMVTAWTLEGSTTEYTGALMDTDGYKISAALSFVSTTAYTTSVGGESLSGFDTAYGSCVESVDD